MIILAVDTSYHGCVIALKVGDLVTKHRLDLRPDQLTTTLSTQLIPLVLEMCEAAGISLSQVTHIAATTGPASFTGLRITLSALQGITLANKAKVYSTTRLHLLAYHLMQEIQGERTISIDNQRSGSFIQTFHKETIEALPQAISEVNVIEGIAESEDELSLSNVNLAVSLLDFALGDNSIAWGGVEQLVPFYGHTPTFKKKF